jgi:hypothetical protein
MYCKESKYNGLNFYPRLISTTLLTHTSRGFTRLLQFRVEETLQVPNVVQLQNLYV